MDRKLIFLGIDGLDPVLLEGMMERGEAPHFRRLSERGTYRRLATIDPPQSPVVWSTIATGCTPGDHGVFDFIRRNPKTYVPSLSLLQFDKFRYVPPVKSKTFWEKASENGIPSVVLKYPVTFPPRPFEGRILAGLGVPDIRGTLGLYTLFTDEGTIGQDGRKGRIVPVDLRGGRVRTGIPGPFSAGLGGKEEVFAPLDIRVMGRRIRCETGETVFDLEVNGWSDWIPVRFGVGFLRSVSGLCRFHLGGISPRFSLYMTPVNVSSGSTAMPVSSPAGYGQELSRAVGPFATLGIAEDTNAMNDGVLDEGAFLSMCDAVMDERERLFEHEFARFGSGILACVFDTTDRIQHMFWRTLDKADPLHDAGVAARYGDVIGRYYRRMDALVGRVLDRVTQDTVVMICSDHGFTSFRKMVHLNTWLAANGFLALEEGRGGGGCDSLFDGVDWRRTKAYAVGLNSLYVNLRGREGRGTVDEEELPRVKERLVLGLKSLVDGGDRVVKEVHDARSIFRGKEMAGSPDLVVGYQKECRASWQTAVGGVPAGSVVVGNTKKWSGDHCCDASFVPGVFFCSDGNVTGVASVLDIHPAIVDRLGV